MIVVGFPSSPHKRYYIYCKKRKKFKNRVDKTLNIMYSIICPLDVAINVITEMREWLSWWSATLPRSRPRVRVPSRALFNEAETLIFTAFPFLLFPIIIMYNICKQRKRKCGYGYRTASKAIFITAYFPDTDKFEKDLKKERIIIMCMY